MYTFWRNIGIIVMPKVGNALANANCIVEMYVYKLENITISLLWHITVRNSLSDRASVQTSP